MEPLSSTLKNSDRRAFGPWPAIWLEAYKVSTTERYYRLHGTGICPVTAKLIFDISKWTSDILNMFEGTFRWKFYENFWLPFISSILERA